MSVTACLFLFAPLLSGCLIAAGIDLGLRIHGGFDSPTTPDDALLALGRNAGWIVSLGVSVVLGAFALLLGRKARS